MSDVKLRKTDNLLFNKRLVPKADSFLKLEKIAFWHFFFDYISFYMSFLVTLGIFFYINQADQANRQCCIPASVTNDVLNK